jgi:glycosyltransferase involved in cell wall biosynthesis
MDVPEISVVIPTYNRGALIYKAVRSCVEQKDCDVEIVVVDDGSRDETRAILADSFTSLFCDESEPEVNSDLLSAREKTGPKRRTFPIIRYFYRQNEGVCAARNFGLARARGEYVKFLDSDDELILHALAKEFAFAKKTGTDVVVTGWQEIIHDGRREKTYVRHVSAPVIDRGIDDMLLGRCPWTAAALYRRSLVKDLSWNADFKKAEDWVWPLSVCLEGARFASLDNESSIYHHYHINRLTSRGNPFLDSTFIRQKILRMVEGRLREDNSLTMSRRNALAQYYYRDAKVLCELNNELWRELLAHCRELVPRFVPVETDLLTMPLLKLFGVYNGIRVFVGLRKIARMFGLKRFRDRDSKKD